MSEKSSMAAALLGVPVAMSGLARLIFGKAVGKQPPKATGLKKYIISGVVISDIDFSNVDGDFSMLECDVIIVPKKLHKDFINGKGFSISQMLTCDYQDESSWKKHEPIKVK